MKKRKRILALLGAALLFLMYASTLIFALIGSETALMWLRASVACTIIVPVMLYGYILVYRALKGRGAGSDEDEDGQEETPSSH